MELVALVSTGKGSWIKINNIIEKGDWDKIFLVGEEYAKKFSPRKPCEFITVSFTGDVEKVREDIINKLRGKLKELEVALCIDSGSGNEHSILISALIKTPVGIRFPILTEKGIKYF